MTSTNNVVLVGRKQITRTSSFIKCSATTSNNANCQATPFLPSPIDERILNKAIKVKIIVCFYSRILNVLGYPGGRVFFT